jgi:hypothetical protein
MWCLDRGEPHLAAVVEHEAAPIDDGVTYLCRSARIGRRWRAPAPLGAESDNDPAIIDPATSTAITTRPQPPMGCSGTAEWAAAAIATERHERAGRGAIRS